MLPFRRQGLFWLPENPSHEVAGTLIWDPDEGLNLNLLGFLDEATDKKPWSALWGSGGGEGETSFGLVHGVLKEGIRDGTFSGTAKWLSLFRCQSTGHAVPTCGVAGENLRPTFIALGNQLPSERFNGVYLRSPQLWDWRSVTGFDRDQRMEKSRLQRRTLTWTPPENEEVTADYVTWRLGIGWAERDQRSVAPLFEEIPYITAESDRQMTVEELLQELAAPIDSLLTLAFDTPVLHEVWGIQETVRKSEADPPKQYVRILFQRVGAGGTGSRPQRVSLISPGTFPGGWQKLIPAWLEVRKTLGDLSGLYFGAEFAPAPFVETRFLMTIQAVEGYHRRSKDFSNESIPSVEHKKRKELILDQTPARHRDWLQDALQRSNQPSLRKRLLDLAGSTQSALGQLIPSPEVFAARCADLRNHYAHMIEIKDRPDGAELLHLTMRLGWVFKTRILMDLGLETKHIQPLIEKNDNYRWLCSINGET